MNREHTAQTKLCDEIKQLLQDSLAKYWKTISGVGTALYSQTNTRSSIKTRH